MAEETDGDVLARLGTDGIAWAAEFAKVFRETGTDPLDPTPGDLLHVWFANAIEAGRSAGYSQGRREATEQSMREVMTLKPYEDGRVSKGLVLHLIQDAGSIGGALFDLVDLDYGPVEEVHFVEAPEEGFNDLPGWTSVMVDGPDDDPATRFWVRKRDDG